MNTLMHYRRIFGASLLLSISVPLMYHSILNYSRNEYYRTLTRELCKAIEPKIQAGATREPLEYLQGMMLRQDFGYTPDVSLIDHGSEVTPHHINHLGDLKVSCEFAGFDKVQVAIFYKEDSLFDLKYIYIYLLSLPFIFGLFLGVRKLLDRFQRRVVDVVQSQIRKSMGFEEIGESSKGFIAQMLNLNLPLLTYLKDHIKNLEKQLEEHTTKLAEQREAQVLTDVAAQVAHDIVAPISTVRQILTTPADDYQENQNIVIEELDRVTALAQKMLKQYRGEPQDEKVEDVNLSSTLSIIAREAEVHAKIKIQVVKSMPPKDIFTEAIKVEIISALSNIVKNAVESIQSENGKVTISLVQVTNTQSMIRIVDNGCGIPTENIHKVFEKDISYKKGGTGLGLYQAKIAIEKLGGEINIKSQVGTGTTVEISIPTKYEKRSVLIPVGKSTHLVFLDDENVIHQAWKIILPKEIPQSQIHFFFTANDFLKWFEQNKSLNSYFFFDQDLSKESSLKGIDIIKKLSLAQKAVLVTGRADDANLQSQAKELQIRLFDKMEIDSFKFQITALDASPYKVDAVLIDDNKANRIAWESSGRLKGLSVRTFESADDFLGYANSIEKRTPIFVDYIFDHKIIGHQIATELLKNGFTKVYIATGLPLEKVISPDGVAGITSKEFPFSLVGDSYAI